MGGGNGQKAKMAREKNLEKTKASKGSQLDSNKKAMNIQEWKLLRIAISIAPTSSKLFHCHASLYAKYRAPRRAELSTAKHSLAGHLT
ncbi:Uncharacterized protein SHERM_07060 [Striga hermonthica]|uniref:Small EDRK-rich factor-like N-terminal domain-containing protein n=1 Tax=Striga hermonthica TaxID=68872 RepID=A0A9N7P0B8_STRHE|nr:Uncharacterized protein SHERM_07060 [Striga hermonthica]